MAHSNGEDGGYDSGVVRNGGSVDSSGCFMVIHVLTVARA